MSYTVANPQGSGLTEKIYEHMDDGFSCYTGVPPASHLVLITLGLHRASPLRYLVTHLGEKDKQCSCEGDFLLREVTAKSILGDVAEDTVLLHCSSKQPGLRTWAWVLILSGNHLGSDDSGVGSL